MIRTVTLAFDGNGVTTVQFIKGTLLNYTFGSLAGHAVGQSLPIHILQAQPNLLQVSQCSNCWFTAEVEDGTGSPFIEVKNTTTANPNGSSMNFGVNPLPVTHVDPGQVQTLQYIATAGGGLALA